MFDNDPDRPSPKRERFQYAYDKFFPVKHQYKEEVNEEVIAASDQMNRPARLTKKEFGQMCRLCRENFYSSSCLSYRIHLLWRDVRSDTH